MKELKMRKFLSQVEEISEKISESDFQPLLQDMEIKSLFDIITEHLSHIVITKSPIEEIESEVHPSNEEALGEILFAAQEVMSEGS